MVPQEHQASEEMVPQEHQASEEKAHKRMLKIKQTTKTRTKAGVDAKVPGRQKYGK
jgi:hypothetical protein